jgi:hypothetical protein
MLLFDHTEGELSIPKTANSAAAFNQRAAKPQGFGPPFRTAV